MKNKLIRFLREWPMAVLDYSRNGPQFFGICMAAVLAVICLDISRDGAAWLTAQFIARGPFDVATALEYAGHVFYFSRIVLFQGMVFVALGAVSAFMIARHAR